MKRFTYFAPHKTALTCSIVLAIGSVIFVVPMAVMFTFIPATDHNGHSVDMAFPIGMVLAMPVFYFVFGYLSTAFFAWCYNKISRFTGGITYETEDV